MSDFFNSKDYSEYFEQLNRSLETQKVTVKKSVSPQKKPSSKKGFYKTVRIRHFRLICAVAILLIITLIAILFIRGCANTSADDIPKTVSSTAEETDGKDREQIKAISYAETENTVKIPKSNDAKTGIIIRKSDNTIVAMRNPHKRIYPASTLKIMTILTAVEHIEDMNDTFTMSYKITDPLYVEDASVAGFSDGEEVTMTDLLYGTILPSGADAATALAIKVAGSEEAFVALMNQKARELGLENTHFTNPTGLHHKDNYSTAYDMAIILDNAMRNEICREVLSTYQHTTRKTQQHPEGIPLQSTLFSYMYGTEPKTAVILGGKTGFVNEAGYCIASFGENKAKTEEYIVVTMGNSSRWPAFYGQIDLYKEFAK